MRSKFTWLLTLFMALMVSFSYAQEKVITGTVSDAGGPLPGANVVVKNTTRTTQTDMDGKYSISARKGEVIEFMYLGLKTVSVTVGDSNVVNASLDADTQLLDTVVVNSYQGAQTKGTVTGAISVVSGKLLENSSLASFDQMLQGQAAGVSVLSGSGQPGSAATVRIHGSVSITGDSSPLYVVDGVPIEGDDFSTLNANDFASVSVLKDASATSIYGSRASGGVIVITTKKGAFDQKTSFTFRSQTGFSQKGNSNFDMMDSSQLLNFQRTIGNGLGAGKTDAQIADLAKVNTNWADVFFRTGKTTMQEFSMRGGSANTRFFNSINYFEQEGIAQRSNLQRFTVRSNFENKPNEHSSLGMNLQLGFSKQNIIDSEGSVTLQNPYAAAYLGSPYDAVYNADGSYNTGPNKIGANAFENLMVNSNEYKQVKVVGNLFAQTEIVDHLTARIDFGTDYVNDYGVRGNDPRTYYGRTEENGQQGFYQETNVYHGKFNTDAKLVYSNTFAEKHQVEIGAYTEYFKDHYRYSRFIGYGINPALVGYYAGITGGTTTNGFIASVHDADGRAGGQDYERGLFSYFGTGKYTYDNRYTISASVRRDASSKFSTANKWGTFWSVGGNWNVLEEDFLKNSTAIETLNLRASYGTTGNQNGIADFQEYALWGNASYNGQTGIAQTSTPNPQLQWEAAEKFDVGIDFSFFKNGRITGTVDYYRNLTTKLLINQQLPLESGLGSIDQNAGSMSNRGIDIGIEGFLIKKKDLSLSLYVNYNYNRNRIEDLGQVSEFINGTAIVRKGLPYGSHYAVGWAGVNPANGQPLYYDANGNVTTVYNEENNSVAKWGTSEPIYSGGFGNRLRWKGLDFSTLFTYAGKYSRYNNQTFFGENPNFANYNQSTKMLTMWQNPGDITEVQSFRYNREFSSKDIEDASFLRLKNVQIGYTFSKDALESIKYISSVRLYLQGQNLYTWTKFTGFDPEDSNNIATYEYPTPRIYTFGVDVNF